MSGWTSLYPGGLIYVRVLAPKVSGIYGKFGLKPVLHLTVCRDFNMSVSIKKSRHGLRLPEVTGQVTNRTMKH
ncbi:hypothetical protein OIDMADRAFT_19809 [Oidiodendron maius Zn]|uniref:Uncharacterized protein n=1 Tax=Oidiodendron maius (strain Zn) TaxID=913774 RepID=A0A0C3H9G6_OIDMZ|nr:hypothetical protein OIDMADRAFT_19809 [Oidiodendron maius Zn]